MGEMEFERKALVKAVDAALQEVEQSAVEIRVTTPGGRFHVRWDEGGSATALGQLTFFAEFLEVSGLFARWRDGCPMAYTSPNAPEVVDVLGTWLLSILDGQRRYAHVTGLRGDEVAPQILGMKKIISDESLRRALAHLAPNQPKLCSDKERAARTAQLARSTAWMDTALSESTREALQTPWILDADTSVKLLYGHQAGAEIGYNPTKPGRPSHTLHTYWIGNLRLVLDVEVQGGKAHAAKHSLPRLRGLLEGLAPEERPVLVRGDIGFGNERVMAEMEEIGQRYLFKLKQTPGVKRLIERLWRQGDWQGVGQGFDAVEGELRLAGWSGARRVVVLRQPVKSSLVAPALTHDPAKSDPFAGNPRFRRWGGQIGGGWRQVSAGWAGGMRSVKRVSIGGRRSGPIAVRGFPGTLNAAWNGSWGRPGQVTRVAAERVWRGARASARNRARGRRRSFGGRRWPRARRTDDTARGAVA